MSLHRFFLTRGLPAAEPAEGVSLPLSDADLHHARHVLRVHPGEQLVVVEPGGEALRVRVDAADADEIRATVIERISPRAEPHVTLVQGLAKGEKMDLVVEKAVEIGVEAVLPVAFERSVVRLDASKARSRVERWRRIAEAAAKQAQRAYVPRVCDVTDITSLRQELSSADVVLLPWEEEADRAPGIGEALAEAGAGAQSRIAVVVGPEGGLTDHEVAFLTDAGAKVVSLGDTVIRTETAGIVAAALCIYETGGLGGRPRA